MDELSSAMSDCNHLMKIEMKAGFPLMPMAGGNELCTLFRTKFVLYEYLAMPFGFTNASATFQRQINHIVQYLLGMEQGIKSTVTANGDGGMVVMAYLDDILIAMNGSMETHHWQVSKVFQMLMEYYM